MGGRKSQARTPVGLDEKSLYGLPSGNRSSYRLRLSVPICLAERGTELASVMAYDDIEIEYHLTPDGW